MYCTLEKGKWSLGVSGRGVRALRGGYSEKYCDVIIIF